jgi:hypothetical protein
LDERRDLLLEPVDLRREGAAALDELACDPGDSPLEFGEALGEPIEVAQVVERPCRRFVAGVELVEMPAEPADHAGSLAHQVFAVVDEQPHLAFGPVELGDRQIRLAESSAGDGERVDRVALPERAGCVPRVRHQLRRHAYDPLAGGGNRADRAPFRARGARPFPRATSPAGTFPPASSQSTLPLEQAPTGSAASRRHHRGCAQHQERCACHRKRRAATETILC